MNDYVINKQDLIEGIKNVFWGDQPEIFAELLLKEINRIKLERTSKSSGPNNLTERW